jgi:hypothetical protein
MESGKPLSSLSEIKIEGSEDGFVVLHVGSGTYHFYIKKHYCPIKLGVKNTITLY